MDAISNMSKVGMVFSVWTGQDSLLQFGSGRYISLHVLAVGFSSTVPNFVKCIISSLFSKAILVEPYLVICVLRETSELRKLILEKGERLMKGTRS